MSTKIYNAYRYKGNAEDLFHELKSIRKIILESMLKAHYKCLVDFSVDAFIGVRDEARNLSRSNVEKLLAKNHLHDWLSLFEDAKRSYKRISPAIDGLATRVFVFFHKRRIFVKFSDSYFIDKIAKLSDRFEDIQYWDNSDRPENITARQWSTRAKLWEKLVPSNAYDADSLVFEVFEPNTLFKLALALNKIFTNRVTI